MSAAQSFTALPCYNSLPPLPRYATLPSASSLPLYSLSRPQESPVNRTGLSSRLLSAFSSRLRCVWDSAYTWLFLIFVLWLGLNAADIAWIYFFIRASIHPNPRTAVNITHTGYEAYKAFMYIFGSIVSLTNYLVCKEYFRCYISHSSDKATRNWLSNTLWRFHEFVVAPVALLMILGPLLSPIVALPVAQQHMWNHGCDNYPIQIILDGRAHNEPSYYPNTARFFQGALPAYTYDLFQSSADDWSFDLRTIDAPDFNQSAPEYPSISNITYDFRDFTVSGNCTSLPSNATTQCISGSFNPNNFLSFSLHDLRTNATTNLRAVDKQWAFSNDAPSFILKDDSGAEVLRTDVTKYGDCTQLKICAAQDTGPDIIVPLALILIRQSEFAVICTSPHFLDDDSI